MVLQDIQIFSLEEKWMNNVKMKFLIDRKWNKPDFFFGFQIYFRSKGTERENGAMGKVGSYSYYTEIILMNKE